MRFYTCLNVQKSEFDELVNLNYHLKTNNAILIPHSSLLFLLLKKYESKKVNWNKITKGKINF